MKKLPHYYYVALVLICIFTAQAHAEISPSQVLVLYNEDWTEDYPLTEKGQDSKEIALHYVMMNTDPATGEKPYILGLSAGRGKLLNHSHLKEKSSDNRSGVISKNIPKMIGSTYQLRDSRLVEFRLPKNEAGWQLNTFKLQIGMLQSKSSKRLTLIENGSNLFPEKILFQQTGNFNVRLNGQAFLSGSLLVNAACTDNTGKIHQWEADFKDIRDVAFSEAGPDNIRDDKNYLELVEKPMKAFLEDPQNALKDGTLLKDHILFMVISYGLPRTCVARYGIERGITTFPYNFGSMIDMGQRLQLLYFDIAQVMGQTPRPHKFVAKKDTFSAFFFRAPQTFALYGLKANPFLHPNIYKAKLKTKNIAKALQFTVQNRKKDTARHLFFVMRLDGDNPLQAKALIDRSVYARKYAKPGMGIGPGQRVDQGVETTGRLKNSPVGQMLWDSGYRRIFYKYTSSNRLELFRLPAGKPFFNTNPVYLPGGIAVKAMSESGWNRKKSSLYKYFQAGVSVTASAAHVYEGAPHIHNKSWWDDSIFYPALMQGRTVGEAFFMNQIHLEWITCFVGDPLLQLPKGKIKSPKTIDLEEIKVSSQLLPKKFGPNKSVIFADIGSNPQNPRLAQMRVRPLKTAKKIVYSCGTFLSKPFVILENREIEQGKPWTIELIDPFGNKIQKTVRINPI